MHTTAILPMRSYCVYAKPLGTSKKKKNGTSKYFADKKEKSSFQ